MSTGALTNVGTEGNAWSSSTAAADSPNASYFAFNSGGWVNTFRTNNRAYGFPVRCVQHLHGCLFYATEQAMPKASTRAAMACNSSRETFSSVGQGVSRSSE